MGERALDGRTDVYALGCVLYELLVGAPPFVGPTAQAIVAKVLTERPTAPSTARDTVSLALDAVILTALSKLPADRHASAAGFAEALRVAMRASTSTTAQASPAATMAQAGSAGGGWRGIALGLAIGAAVGAAVFAGISGARASGAMFETPERRVQLTFDGIARHPAISADGRFVAYVMSSCPGGPELPCRASLQVQEIGGSRPITLVEDALEIGRPRWTHDGSQVVYPARLDSARSGIYAVPRLGGDARLVTSRFGDADTHPKADSLAVVAGEWLFVLDLALGHADDSLAMPPSPERSIAWSPDGRRFAIAANYRNLMVVSRDGTTTDSVAMPTRPDVAWNRAGTAVMSFRAREGTVDDLVQFPVDGKGRLAREPRVLLAGETTALFGEFDVARETGRLVILSGSALFDYWRVPLDRPAAAERLTQGTAWYGKPSVAANGRTAYYMRGDAVGDNVYVIGLDSHDSRERALTREALPGGDLGMGFDDRRLIFTHTAPAGPRAGEMRLPSGEVSFAPYETGIVTSGPTPVGRRGVTWLAKSAMAIIFADSLGAPTREISLGDGRVGTLARGGSNERDVFVSTQREVDSRTRHEVVRVPVDGRPVAVLATLPARPLSLDIRSDGSAWIARWVPGDASLSLWEIPAGGGTPRRRASLPPVCTAGRLAVAGAAPVAVCTAAVRRSDVWVVDGVSR